jgi:hypothetical protein
MNRQTVKIYKIQNAASRTIENLRPVGLLKKKGNKIEVFLSVGLYSSLNPTW